MPTLCSVTQGEVDWPRSIVSVSTDAYKRILKTSWVSIHSLSDLSARKDKIKVKTLLKSDLKTETQAQHTIIILHTLTIQQQYTFMYTLTLYNYIIHLQFQLTSAAWIYYTVQLLNTLTSMSGLSSD